jgi:hypothetical protein
MQKKYLIASALTVASFFLATPYLPWAEANESLSQSAASCGLVPPSTQVDNFSELNFENFALIYSGGSSTQMDPSVDPLLSINTTSPINGVASLQATSDAEIPQSWFLVSNAFFLGTQYTVSVDVRLDEGFLGASQTSTVETGLIGAISAYNRTGGSSEGYGPNFSSTLDALRLQHTVVNGVVKDYVILSVGANYDASSSGTSWKGGTNTTVAVTGGFNGYTEGNDVYYTLSITYGSNGITKATVVDQNGNSIASITPTVSKKTTASAFGMYMNFPALASTPTVNFADVTVTSATPYSVAGNQYTRAPYPHFVQVNRYPDVSTFGGDWVGAPTGFYDTTGVVGQPVVPEYKMWYRQRSAAERGYGFAYATSPDGINWTKYTNEEGDVVTVFVPTATPDFQSVEKISVVKVPFASSTSGYLYQAWYSILPDSTDGNGWRVAYAYSYDGINWIDQGIIDNSTYYKDPVVIVSGNTYYMYVLYGNGNEGEGTQGKVLTCSSNCATTTIPHFQTASTPSTTAPVTLWNTDGHAGVFYAQNSKNYWLYLDNSPSMYSAASTLFNFCTSSRGCPPNSGAPAFKNVLSASAVGLDDDTYDQAGNGVNYPFFMTNEAGQLASDQNVLMYYQARHSLLNNASASWQDLQDGKIVLAGNFTSYYVGLPTTISYTSSSYPSFPVGCTVAQGFSNIVPGAKSNTFVLNITAWPPTASTTGHWTLQNTGANVTVTFPFTGMVANTSYTLQASTSGAKPVKATSSKTGTLSFSVTVPANATTGYTLTQ